MQLTNAPEPFSPAFGEILYALSLTESEKGEEIGIFNSEFNEKIGIKKIVEAPEFQINVSDYVRCQIRIEPFPIQECGIIDAQSRARQSCIAYPGGTATCFHTGGIIPATVHEPLSEKRVRTLGENEQDEICWIADTGTISAKALFPVTGEDPIEIRIGEKIIYEKTIAALILNSGHIDRLLQEKGKQWSDFQAFSVEIKAGTEPVMRFEYRISPRNCNKKRFAWWNRYGGIDFYSFEVGCTEKMLIEKEQVQVGDRKFNLTAQSRKVGVAATSCTTREFCEWLSAIAAAPQVWIVENEEFVPVEITDTAIPVYDPDRTELELHFKYSRETDFQSF